MRIPLTDRALDLDAGVVVHGGDEHALTPTETALLRYLAAAGEAGASRETLLREVWGYSPKVLSRTVDATVRRLRSKLEADPTRPAHLLTVYGEGYRLHVGEPVFDTSFVGRAAEEAAIAAAYAEGARVVTLLGVGGAGKSTLARRIAARRGATWVELGRLPSTPRDIAVAVLEVLSVEAGRDPVGQAGDALRGREGLFLVLDEAERVSDTLPSVLARWLAEAAHLRVLVTSRHRLGLAAERVVPVGGLSRDEARALLASRALDAGAPVRADDPALAALADALEGLPLALELAAARLAVLTPAELLERLSRRIDLLRAERADRPERHSTLRAVLDGSWELLDDRGRRALARLGLLPGGVSVPVAEALLGPDALDVLAGLRDRSLIRDAPGPEGRRWDMFEHVRTYAVEHADPEAPGAVSRAVLAATEPLGASMRSAGGPQALRRLGAERANLRVALDLAPDAETMGRLALVLDPVLAWRGPAAEQIEVLEKALAADPPDRIAADLWRAVAYPLHSVGRLDDARHAGERAEALAGVDPELRARVSIWRAMHVMDTVDAEAALAPAEEAVRLARASGVGSVEGAALAYLAFVHVMRRDLDRGAAVAVDALASVRASGAPQVEPNVLYTLGNLRVTQGRVEEARQHYREAATKYAEWGATWREANVVLTLGNVDLVEGSWDSAREHYLRALGMYRRFGQRRGEVLALSNLGWVALEAERFDEARSWLSEGLGLSRRLADAFGEGHHLAHLGALALAEGRPAEATARYDEAVAVLGASRRAVWVRLRRVEAWAGQGRVDRVTLAESRADLLAHGDHPGAAAADLVGGHIDIAEGDPERARARLAAYDPSVERSPGETREVRRNLERRLTRLPT